MIRVVWSKQATKELVGILDYWDKRNQSESYSQKIEMRLNLSIQLIRNNPLIGIVSDFTNVRMRLVLNHFYLIYRIEEEKITILRFWDVRQKPLKFIKK